jgi:LacI family transcriptional regulator
MTPTLTIGLVFDYSRPYARGVLRGIGHYAQTQPHWSLEFHDTQNFVARKMKLAEPPAGFIAHVVSKQSVRLLMPWKKTVVNISSAIPDAPFPRVGIDNREVGRMAFRHFVDLGLRNFALVGHPRHQFSTEREIGYRESITAGDLFYGAFLRGTRRSDAHGANPLFDVDGLRRWLRDLPKPVGVFACHDVWGVQVVEACRSLRLRVPEDVAVICVDTDNMLCERSRPSLSSILVPSEQIGYEAAVLLEKLLTGAPPPAGPQLVSPASVIARKSSDTLAGGDPELMAAVRFIRASTDRPLNVEDVLQIVPASRRSLERKFRAVLRCGISEEIRRVQVERAKTLLSGSALSVTEIAGHAGFNSIHHLSRVFRRETGETPTGYRNKSSIQNRLAVK